MKERILIVDDSPLVHQVMEAHLQEAGYEILHAHDGFEAINLTFKEMPDLIILDINMPKINGWQVCRLLKDHPLSKQIPIIIGTSAASATAISDPRQWSIQTGADDFFNKNLDSMDSLLIPLVKKQLEKKVRADKPHPSYPPLSELEIMSHLSHLLDIQLYKEVSYLKELDERKNAFVANVSHEFRSPLTVIGGYLSLMQAGKLGQTTKDQDEGIERNLRTVNRLIRLVTDLLDLSKIEAGKMILKKEKIDLAILLDDVIKLYSVTADEKKIELQREISKSLPLMFGDKDRLMQVMINLLYNSIKFTPENGKITLRLLEEGPNLRFEIEDTGHGIAKEDLEKIFDKFERVAAEKKEGTGLGLPISQDIVKLHGGKIRVESELEKGSKFIVLLPMGGSS